MQGHIPIIQMRMKRKAPRIVFVNDYPCQTDWFENEGDAATVSVHGDAIETLDLRFLVGLRVSISSPQENRAKALLERCRDIGVAAVASCHIQTDKKPFEQNGWTGIWVRPEMGDK